MTASDIRTLRHSMSLDQTSFASLIPVALTTVYRWERGETNPSPMALRRLREIREEHSRLAVA